jgi:glutathione synthase/RimK-type ligase-like ATP-grasp enzyme
MMKTIALITWAGLLEGAESERLLLPLLAARGVSARLVDWRNSSLDFNEFDLLLLRSCWDYHLHYDEFAGWLHRTAKKTPVLNTLETVLWNSNKFYLQELESRGLEIPPTCFVPAGALPGENDLEQIRSWPQAVVKPAVSASAHNTRLVSKEQLASPGKVAEMMRGKTFLVQQFVPEVRDKGEISFIYFDGAYSHAVLKRPGQDDFRVQVEHGGSAELFVPPASLLRQADEIAVAVPQVRDSLYCRIDAIEKDGRLVLMELELIEPELFLGLAEGAALRFAQAILRRLAAKSYSRSS